MINTNVKLKNLMEFKNQRITDIMEWAVNNVFQIIWNDPDWQKCAKGGSEYKYKSDMLYKAHIFSGVAMALKCFDYNYNNKNLNINIDKIKRSIVGYVFHDYNKLDNYKKNFYMNDDNFIKSQLPKFKKLCDELNLSEEDLYKIAFSTEKDTEFNMNRNDISLENNLLYESNFSRLADQLSSIYNDLYPEYDKDIFFGTQRLVDRKKIKKIVFGSTNFIVITSILRRVIYEYINKDDSIFYLWGTVNSIYYVADKEIEYDAINNTLKTIEEIAEKNTNNGIKINDRRFIISTSNIVPISKKTIENFVKNESKFRECMHLESIKIKPGMKIKGQKYTDMIYNNTKSFKINFYKINKNSDENLRDFLEIAPEIEESDIDERKKAFLIRYVQLSTSFNSNDANKIRDILKSTYSNNQFLNDFLPKKNREKSVLFIPLILNSKDIDWYKLEDEIIKNMNTSYNYDNNIKTLKKIIEIILNKNNDFPEVPEKAKMSMISGYTAKEKAQQDDLFGIGTQSFNNRLLSGASNGKIDEYSKFEFSIRKLISPKLGLDNTGFIFFSFPGALPYMNIQEFFKMSSINSRQELTNIQIHNIDLTTDNSSNKITSFKTDNIYYMFIDNVKDEINIVRYFYNALEIAQKTSMHVTLSFSNNPIEFQMENVKVDLSSSVISGMTWDSIRCDQLSDITKKIEIFNWVSGGKEEIKSVYDIKDDIVEVMLEYMRSNLTIFYYAHKLIFSGKVKKVLLKDKIEVIRKLACERGEIKMENIIKMAKTAANLRRLRYDSSSNDRGWIMRESLEVIETVKAKTGKSDLKDYREFVAGHINSELSRKLDSDLNREKANQKEYKKKNIDINKVNEFAEEFIAFLKDDMKETIPSGNLRSYVVDAFEIEYMLASMEEWNKKGGKDGN